METLSKKERRKAERQARKEQGKKDKTRHRAAARLQKLGISLLAFALLVAAGYWAYGRWTTGSPGEFVPSLGNRHIGQTEIGLVTYNSNPPTSGPHLPYIAPWGISDTPIPKELQVHNLEDGGVMVQYNCDQTSEECRSLIEKLTRLVGSYDHVLLAPYPGMGHKIALTAWTRIDTLDEFDRARIVRFIEAYAGIDHHPAGGEIPG